MYFYWCQLIITQSLKSYHFNSNYTNSTSAPLVVKKLRYIARFVVVALLLNRADIVKNLHDNLSSLVEEYNQAFKPTDYSDWKVVLSEISTFIEVSRTFIEQIIEIFIDTTLKTNSDQSFMKHYNRQTRNCLLSTLTALYW